MPDKADVSTPSITFTRLEKRREICRDLMGGLPRLIEKAATYFPREPMEQPVRVAINMQASSVPGTDPSYTYGVIDPWKLRVNRTRPSGVFQDAVDALSGKAFAKSPEPEEETPEQLVEFLDDVDLQGNAFAVFALGRCATAVAEGLDLVLVDFQAVDANVPRSAEDDRRAKLSPFWRSYSPGSLIGWKKETRNGVVRATELRLHETVIEHEGWGEKEVDQWRVFYAGNPDATDDSRWCRWEVRRKNEKGEEFIFSSGLRRPQVDIPLVGVPTDETGLFEACPPLLDLAHLEIAYLRKASDLDNAQHIVGFPWLHWSGVPVDEGQKQLSAGIGPSRFLISPSESGDAKFVEPAGTSWSSIEATMAKMEEQMHRMAGEPLLASAPGNLTATGEAIRASKAHSKLGAWVLRWEDAFSRLLYYTAIDLGIVKHGADAGWGGIKLNRQFVPTERNIEGARVAHERNMANKLSDETTFEVLQGAEILPDTLTYEDEQKRINAQPPPTGLFGRENPDEDKTFDEDEEPKPEENAA